MDAAIAAPHQILLTFLSKEEHHFDKVPVVSQSGEIKRLVSHGVVSGCELVSDIWSGTGPIYNLGKLYVVD